MSFTNAPVSRTLVYGLIGASIAASLLDIKHYFYILVDLHLWRFHQTWRALIFQLCFTNSSEVLFAALTLYNMRDVERLWGSRKYATFVLVTFLLTSITSPVLLAFVLRPISLGLLNYLPAGPTPVIFAILAQYHAMIPHTYKYKIATSITPTPSDQFQGVTFTDKSYRYLLALQLALFQWPGSLIGASVGWVVGYAWRMEVLPRSLMRWRIPGWVVGIRAPRRSQEFEGLRRRLEDEGAPTASTTGADGQADGAGGRRRATDQLAVD
ncbi:hypothetical protein F4808DRAFT_68197 [Astrocystis sublimbata]|nr:hypothetical protein F4808DRAFT_68197 [Astrocystis sublimbata]